MKKPTPIIGSESFLSKATSPDNLSPVQGSQQARFSSASVTLPIVVQLVDYDILDNRKGPFYRATLPTGQFGEDARSEIAVIRALSNAGWLEVRQMGGFIWDYTLTLPIATSIVASEGVALELESGHGNSPTTDV